MMNKYILALLTTCLVFGTTLISCKKDQKNPVSTQQDKPSTKKEITGSVTITLPERTIELSGFDTRESGVNFQPERALYSLRPLKPKDVFMQVRIGEEGLYQKSNFQLEIDNTRNKPQEKFDFFFKEGAPDSLNTIRFKSAIVNVAELTDSTLKAEISGAVAEGARGKFQEKDATATIELNFNRLDSDER